MSVIESSPTQLSLGVSLNDDATFTNFFVSSDANRLVIDRLFVFSQLSGDSHLVIWGRRGSGLTHLLQACTHMAQRSSASVQYLPLRELVGYSASDVCEGLDRSQMVCLDGIDEICGNREWEEAIFHLYNRLRDAGRYLLIGAHTSPPSLPIMLPDLKSRVLGCTVYHVEGLNDHGKALAMQNRAKARGIQLTDEVVEFILKRAPRDTNDLFNLLDRLDDASLQHQRKLTIPFVKEVLKL